MKKTARQLAEELGVSATTVSLAFRGSKSISKATRERVLAAAKAAGMEIPGPSKELVPTAHRDFALICSNFVERIANIQNANPFILNMVKDMGKASVRQGARLMTLFELPENLDQAPFDGFFAYTFQDLEPLSSTSKPVVYLDYEIAGGNSVAFDIERSMQQLAMFIREKGYRHPMQLLLTHVVPKFDRACELLQYYLSMQGIQLDRMIYNQDSVVTAWDLNAEWQLVRECALELKKRDDLPDILICSNDCIAAMLQIELHRLGIEAGQIDVPGVIPLFGYDDIVYIAGTGSFSTFHIDTAALSDAAVRLMNGLLDSPVSYKQHIQIEAEMIIR